MMRDEKLVSAAVKSKQPVERVVWVWGAILESAAEINDGGRYDFDPDEAAYFLRCDGSEIAGILSALESLGRVSEGLVARWCDRQYESDTSTERVRKYREKKKLPGDVHGRNESDGNGGNADVTFPDRFVTPPETDTEAEIVIPTSREDRLAFDAYNDLAHEIAIPVAQNLTDERKTKIKARLNECGGLAGWLDALGKIRGSPFLRGDNDRQWKANLDFILQKSTFTRLMEGSYDGQSRPQPPRKNGSIADSFAILDAVADEAIRRAGGLEPQDGEADTCELSGLRKSAA